MANVIDIIVSKQAQAELDKVIASLRTTHDEIIKINQQGLKINSGASPKNPQQMNTSVKETIALNEKLEATNNKLIASEKKLQNERIKDLQLQKQREQSVDKYNTQLSKEQTKLAAAANMYNRLQAEMNKLQFAYQNLAVKQAQGATLTKVEAQQMDYLRGRIQMHDKTLKSVDANMGKYGRNVGNYASGFNPLNNSIAQLGREMPAFANSVQTGFMAISNNLPIFFDAMQGVINQNKELQAQGKPTKSVLSQLAGGLFSFQTLLSVGVTLLTVYGKEIVNWVSALWGASEALDELNKNQKEFNNSRVTGTKESIKDTTELEKRVRTMRNSNLTDQERLIALKEIRSQFPFYFQGLKDEALLNGNIENNLKKLNKALKDNGVLNKAQEANIKNKERLVDLREELRLNELNIAYNKKQLEQRKKVKISDDFETAKEQRRLTTDASNKYNDSLNKRLSLQSQINQFDKAIATNKKIENDLAGKTVGLRYKEDVLNEKKKKDLKELADLQIDQVDYLAREFELRKKILENGISNNKLIADDEKNTLSERIDAYKLYMSLKQQLVQEDYDEQNRIIDSEYKSQINSINDAYDDQIKSINKGVIDGGKKRVQAENEKNEALKALEKKYFYDRQISYTDFEQKQKEIRDTFSKEEEYALLQKFTKLNQLNEIQQAKLNALQNRNFTGGTLTKESPLSAFKTYYEDRAKIEEDAKVKSLKNDLEANKTKLQSLTFNNKTNSEEYKKLIAEKISLETQLQDVVDANEDKKIKKLEEYKTLLDNTFKGFIDDFGGGSGFGKMLDILNGGLDKFEGDAKAVALTISEAFQEAFNTISASSQANFDAEYNRLEMQKNVSLQFAGESATAKEEIERQYEEKRRAIARREAEAKKKQAIFNIAIDTAQAVVAALPKIPLSIAIGVLGAAQIAVVNSQQIPQFWKGTDNAPEGLAWTQEKGAEVITDKKGNVKTMGNNKGSQLTYLEKGDKVYKSQQDYINKTLVGAGIQPIRERNSLTTNDFNNGISKLAKTMQGYTGSETKVYLNNKQINTDYYKGKKV